MKLFLDNLFFLGGILSLTGLAGGAWLVLRESLVGIVCPNRKSSGLVGVLVCIFAHPFRRVVRI